MIQKTPGSEYLRMIMQINVPLDSNNKCTCFIQDFIMNHLKHPLKHVFEKLQSSPKLPFICAHVHCKVPHFREPYTVINGDGKTPSEQAELAGLELL